MSQIQLVNSKDLYSGKTSQGFNMIDNYIYLYHTDTLIVLPVYPDSFQDSMPATYSSSHPMLRSAPIFSYSNSGPRQLEVTLPLHRDMMNSINVESTSMFSHKLDILSQDDYVDTAIKQLQSAALPRYNSTQKMVDPPLVAVRFGNSIFCKGVVDGGVTATHSGPILSDDKYAFVTVSFIIKEVDPYDADTVALEGGYRGIRTTLQSKIYKSV